MPSFKDLARGGFRASATRFAPSPTGYLHLGHVASALCVWGVGRAAGAKVYLRIEDHDQSRCRPEYEEQIFADLEWLGFKHDNDDLRPHRPSSFRQSHVRSRYDQALAELRQNTLVYGCDCSRQRIAQAAAYLGGGGEKRYDGHCRTRKLPLPDVRSHRSHLEPTISLANRMQNLQVEGRTLGIRAEIPANFTVMFEDLWLGRTEQQPQSQCGDLLLHDRHGQYTYQFCVVVDDLVQGIDLVVRGQDLTTSTGRQIWLAERLGRKTAPTFAHHPLLLEPASGQKLSKRNLSESVASRRARGETPEQILGEAAFLLGLLPRKEPLRASDAGPIFLEYGRTYG